MPSFFRRVLHQMYLLLKTGVNAPNYYRCALWRKQFSHGDVEDYLGGFYSGNWQESVSPQPYRALMNDKLLLSLFSEKANLPTPPVLAVFSPKAPDIHSATFRVWDDFGEWLSSGQQDLFIKPLSGVSGKGALSLGIRLEGDTPTWQQLPLHEPITLTEIEQHVLRGDHRDYIVQARLEPSTQLAGFSKEVLQTLRIVTIRLHDKVHVVAATLKIAGGKSAVDNLLIGQNLIAPVGLDSGILGRAVYLENDQPIWIDVHPVTNQQIEGIRLEYWKETLDIAQRAADCFPWFKSIGWDIAITDNGPVIVEPNYSADMALLQIAHGRGMLSWPEFREFFFGNGLHRYIALGLMAAKK